MGLAEFFPEKTDKPVWYVDQVEPIYHACYLARGETEKAILTMYSVLAYGMSQDCYQTVERIDFGDPNWAPFHTQCIRQWAHSRYV